MSHHIRLSDRVHSSKADLARAALRLALYGVLGVAFEVAAFPIVRIGRRIPIVEYLFAFDSGTDSRLDLGGPWRTPLETLFGQTSLWMIPIYALVAFCIEVLYRRLLVATWWPIRALVYGVVILVLELVSGLVVKALTGYAIWMYRDAGNILEMTSVYILPVWMFVGLSVELLYRELMDPHIRIALEAKLASCQTRQLTHNRPHSFH